MKDKLVAAFKKYVSTPLSPIAVEVDKDVSIWLRADNRGGGQPSAIPYSIVLINKGHILHAESITQAEFMELYGLLMLEVNKLKESIINKL